MVTLQMIQEAQESLKGIARKTPLENANRLGENIYIKSENLQLTGAFKIRGAYNKIRSLTPEEASHGVIACSAGNHAQGIALSATKLGIKSVICMPEGAPISKVEATRNYGAEVVLVPGVYDDAAREAERLSKEHGYTFAHPFNDPYVIAGQGTIGLEILEQLPEVEQVVVPIGGGGLSCGVSTFAKLYNPKIRVIGVEPAGAACMKASVEAGHVVKLPAASTIADGTAVLEPGDLVYPYVRDNVDEIITVEDEELIVSFLDMVENHKMVVENSGLLTVAALKHLPPENKRVVSILSGGNMDVITMSSVVQHGLIQRGRIFTVCVLLPDRPGMLLSVASIIARENGNVIKLEHNQFVSTNRNAAVELRVTVEAFGEDHKRQIVDALEAGGFDPSIVQTSL